MSEKIDIDYFDNYSCQDSITGNNGRNFLMLKSRARIYYITVETIKLLVDELKKNNVKIN
jgi:hypothetical protein